MITLEVKGREAFKNVVDARKNGLIPAVYYGSQTKSTPIYVSEIAFNKMFKEAGESTIVELAIGKEKLSSLVHDVQFDAVSGKPNHADFYIVEANQTLTVSVPFEFVGVSEAVKSLGATLIKVMHEIEVECLPQDLPHEIVVDISKLATLEDNIFVKDLVLPKGVKVDANETDVIASVVLGKEEIEVPVVPIDLSAIEVEKKGKKDEESEGEKEETTA